MTTDEKKIERRLVWRWRIALAFFVFAFLGVGSRAAYLQVIDAGRLDALAKNEIYGTIEILPKRGDIFDRSGGKLAASLNVQSVYAQPKEIKDVLSVSSGLARILTLNQSEVLERLRSGKSFVWIKRKIAPTEEAALREAKLPGIGFLPETKRVYPRFTLAAHVLGFVGLDGGGLEGLELKYDSWLRGRKLTEQVVLDARKRVIDQRESRNGDNSLEGASLVLTLDEYIQYVVEKELAKVRAEQEAKAAMAIVADPRTGRILAMSVQPTFNPNIFSEYETAVLRNKTVTDCFEPGSTMKVFTASMVLENHAARPTDMYFCENGAFRLGRHTIHDTHKYGWLSLQKIIQVSSNIGALKIGQQLDADVFFDGLKKFGFGRQLGIDLPGESPGILRNGASWSMTDKAVISFGQGISVSPLQVMMGISAIANGGLLMKPYLVDRIVSPDGKVLRQTEPQVLDRAISKETAAQMASILQLVVLEGGTGTQAAIEGFAVAGKTGTAQKVNPGTRGYAKSKYVSSFAGFLPADNPQLAVLVMVDEPKKRSYGGLVAAPVFKTICEQTIPYLGIRPTEVFLAQKHLERALQEVKDDLKKPAPSAGPSSAEAAEVEAISDDEEETMPNLVGMDLRTALSSLDELGLDVQIEGSGYVVRQQPQAGQSLTKIEKCRLWLSQSKGLQS